MSITLQVWLYVVAGIIVLYLSLYAMAVNFYARSQLTEHRKPAVKEANRAFDVSLCTLAVAFAGLIAVLLSGRLPDWPALVLLAACTIVTISCAYTLGEAEGWRAKVLTPPVRDSHRWGPG